MTTQNIGQSGIELVVGIIVIAVVFVAWQALADDWPAGPGKEIMQKGLVAAEPIANAPTDSIDALLLFLGGLALIGGTLGYFGTKQDRSLGGAL